MALEAVQAATPLAEAVLAALGLSAVALMVPAARAVRLARAAITAQAVNDLIQARVKGAESRNSSLVAMGFAGALVVVLLTVLLFVVNNLAVSRVFFYIPLISSSFWLMVKAFWINIYIFMVAEILVLIWGLVIAIARMAPGSAGRPVRMLATFYVDIFRSLPGIITIYLIGFGLPLTHLPVLKDLSQESLAIIALTLTNGAYTAEIYRAGIESIHWSQTAAARSLGLSYMQTLRYVVVPQGVRNIIPPMLNSFISLQKDTALVNVIGTIDAFNQSIIVASNNFNLSPVTTVALLFIAITIPQTRLVDRMIARDRRRMRIGGS
ncbi:amino acid ABC transporter permease [Mesorhizobium sp. ES1-4]|uniref:amino acid ABC transporter permease n=1 Tax=Mesorhizobium sp. ES1-4 TaxID=2876627 RepID=UPI001CCCF1C0|nr:amino acid ABC transporter permease [Mesorhizobium sp. ES1-4]MBZ9798450.1 amino acid ABC transporter permease [Mesorhizobium sp. ES1-4]